MCGNFLKNPRMYTKYSTHDVHLTKEHPVLNLACYVKKRIAGRRGHVRIIHMRLAVKCHLVFHMVE